jgi:hypothetical protein
MPDHDVVAAPFADGHIATVVSASISPIIVAPDRRSSYRSK